MKHDSVALTGHKYHAFDAHYRMYNWFYPLDTDFYRDHKDATKTTDIQSASKLINSDAIETRALYFHIPFCDTMCSFCPFIKGGYQHVSEIGAYVEALLKEIHLKAQVAEVTAVPVNTIFFGGGTPSVLSPVQIQRIGQAIADHFDLSRLQEFSFEVEAKSINDERADALRSIGVTHGRFGFQTFDETYRKLFTLTASVDQCLQAASTLMKHLPNVSFDILYGMDGQTFDHLGRDLELATSVGTNNIDVYPVNNVVTQLELHRGYRAHDFEPLPASKKLAMRRFADDVMRTNGFLPHNGHGYVRSLRSDDWNIVTTDDYRFHYHDSVYGYESSDIIGFGSSAVSLTRNAITTNVLSRKRYTKELLHDGMVPVGVRVPESYEYPTRPINGCLPYHGAIEKKRVSWSQVHPEALERLAACVDAGLVAEDATHYRLTRTGWLWYANLMYYLTPSAERRLLDDYVSDRLRQDDRLDGDPSIAAFAPTAPDKFEGVEPLE